MTISSREPGEGSDKKRATPPPTPTKKSPEKKIPKVAEGTSEGLGVEDQTVEPPKELPKLPNKTAEQSMLDLALEKIAMLEQQLQTTKEPVNPVETPKPPQGSAIPGVAESPLVAAGTEVELGEGSDKPEDDGDNEEDMIVMPTGTQVTEPKQNETVTT